MSGRRDELLAEIRRHSDTFAEAGIRSEEIRTLPETAVSLLADLGLFWLKTPAELGGTPLDPLEFCDVIEELAYADASVAWAAMIGSGCGGLAGGWLPGASGIFAAGGPLPVVAGQPSPRGTGVPVDGGFTVSGRWGFSSGIAHADWLLGAFPAGSRVVLFAVPKSRASVIDHWHVAGLQGTGSLDWTLEEVFVPSEMTYVIGSGPARGGALFRLGFTTFIANEVPPWCAGVARRALDDITALAAVTARAPGGPPVSEREVFQSALGRAEVRLRAARAAHRDAMSRAWSSARAGSLPSEAERAAVAAASVYAAETCFDVVSDLFRYGGGRLLSLSSPVQRHLRDLLAARQHRALSDEAYEAAGRLRLGITVLPGGGHRVGGFPGDLLDEADAAALGRVVVGQDRHQHALAAVGDRADAVDHPQAGIGQPAVLESDRRPGIGGGRDAPGLGWLDVAHQVPFVALGGRLQDRASGHELPQQPQLVVGGGLGQPPVRPVPGGRLPQAERPVRRVHSGRAARVPPQGGGGVIVAAGDHRVGELALVPAEPGFPFSLLLVQPRGQDVGLLDARGGVFSGAAVGRPLPRDQVLGRDRDVPAVFPGERGHRGVQGAGRPASAAPVSISGRGAGTGPRCRPDHRAAGARRGASLPGGGPGVGVGRADIPGVRGGLERLRASPDSYP